MAVSIVQSKFSGDLSGTSGNVTMDSSITTGSTIVVLFSVSTGVDTVFAASDATNGSYTKEVENSESGSTRNSTICYKANVTGGFTNVAWTKSPTGFFRVAIFEITGNSATPQSDAGQTTSSGTSHDCSGGSGGVTGTGFIALVGSLNNNFTYTITGYTDDTTGTTNAMFAHRIGTVSSELGAFTSSGSGTSRNAMIMFVESSVPPAKIRIAPTGFA